MCQVVLVVISFVALIGFVQLHNSQALLQLEQYYRHKTRYFDRSSVGFFFGDHRQGIGGVTNDVRHCTAPPPTPRTSSITHRMSQNVNNDDDLPSFDLPEEEAEKLKQQSELLRQQIRALEEALEKSRKVQQQRRETKAVSQTTEMNNNNNNDDDDDTERGDSSGIMTLRQKRVLVTGANGRLGSFVCRHLLRNHPEIGEVVAVVHVVSENSPTGRGYSRLSYEVGAEDGIGAIGPAWSSSTEERTATFQFNSATMGGYNLHKLRIVECELLDPIQCNTVCENVDTVIWCATDFNGNTPRAVSGLDMAFLFRAVASPFKGRVEIEGVHNMLGALKLSRQERKRRYNGEESKSDPINFLLVSMVPEAYGNYETPFGEFNALKRQAEHIVRTDFPSLTYTILQMGQFEDNFIPEGEPITITENDQDNFDRDRRRRLIPRRDAAKAVVEALANPDLVGRTVQVYTTTRTSW